ncbi:16S rRNA (cytosine(1402)-N(4))-methyltransferase RsmH [Clostridium sp. PL3]|uniref:Ribosomal RNA small subunit methyltransferase H n=1 Tax=Clostridium thailandense TaxID=2794346 RepID=A0A949WT61_9CLOT|nr:16S rRNA (cytosine(1402)-N(4))-methyltransferase RsmH [Clostridium thailandense]MBV7275826.1 16S rRNA (cytosine(1402)-N(4))-methyltransferase RsmH [Clostridium thailandense]
MNQDNILDEKEPKHQRRPRYKGTHPRNFKEKYKELNPEKYSEDIAKIIQKGKTPAGMHISICVKEILDILQIKPGQTGLDATLGYGGHTLEMLKCLDSKGHMYALDVDPIELPKTKERLESLGYGPEILEIKQMNFSQVDQVTSKPESFNFILADLGVSSMQIDNPERGFTFKADGPLDLRLNPNEGISAAELLKELTLFEIEDMLIENADEPHAAVIARAILSTIKKGIDILTTTQLRNIIQDALKYVPKIKDSDIRKSCQRTFQALRIAVNSEFKALDEFLEKLPDVLASGGRVAILTFHSGEDRRVKKSFKHFFREGVYSEIAPEPIRPSSEECRANSRASCAKLRFAIKA